MKTIIRLCCFILLMNSSVYAEVITDGSLGSATTLTGQMDIPQNLGTTIGNNLFHSFNTFNINTGESATFTGDNALKNVISRVTGGQVSTIDGLLQSTIGTANFYFINPAGVTFGVNAQIDVPAAFYMSTADSLRFADGSQFSASNLTANGLSIAEPTGFGFLNNQGGNIEVQGSILDFKNGSTVALSAHNVIVNNGWLTSPSGHIQVYATGDTATELPINAPPTNALTGRIELTAASSLDTSADTGGKITLQGGDIVIKDGSSVIADTLTGNAGGVSVKSNTLRLLNGGRIGSDTWDTGNAGNITVDATTLVVDGQGGNQFTAIASDTLNDVIANAGNAGAVSIKANNLTVANGGQISSDTWGSGHAANVAIDATNILVDGQGNGAWISGNSNNDQIINAGNAGNVSINASVLAAINRGQISSDAWGTGHAGSINIQANDVFVDGKGTNQFTGIASNTNNDLLTNAGNAGSISIKSNSLSVSNTGQIVSDTWGSGQAGNIAIDAASISVDGQALISSSSRNSVLANAGNAGTVNLKANSLAVSNKGQITTLTSGTGHAGNIIINSNDTIVSNGSIHSDTDIGSTGNAGSVLMTGNNLAVSNSGQVSSDTLGSGNAGNIAIDAATISVDGQALISSSSRNSVLANAGNAGTVNLKANSLAVSNKGQVTTLTSGTGHAGNITVNSNDTVINNGSIHSDTGNASTGNAGSVLMTGNNLAVSNSGQISSDTLGSGNAGNIAIDAATISVDGQALISSSSRNAVLANAGNAGTVNLKANSLAVANKGQVTTLTSGTGHAGNILVNSNDTLISNGLIHSNTDEGSTGNAGSVFITGANFGVSNGGQISSDTLGSGNAGNIALDVATISVDGQGVISSSSRNLALGNAGTINLKANSLAVSNSGQITTLTSGTGYAGNIIINSNDTFINNGSIVSNADSGSTGHAGSVIITGDTLTALNNGHISSDTAGSGNGGNVSLNSSRSIIARDGASISSSTSGAGRAGNITITAPVITVDNANISAEANAQSQGQTGNINITATKAIYLANHGKISLKNAATIANTGNITPSSITVSAPDIDLKDSEITTAATGNIDAGNININFSHWLTMDPSFISTTANTGNGGTITIRGGELIRLQNSGFLTSVSGANSNGGNINVSADQLVMDTGVIQANAVGGSGGDINLNLKALLTSQNRLILGGNRVTWQPFVSGLNVIQAASENGVNGVINVTSPQFDISASVSGLDSAQLVMPSIDSNLCQSSAMLGSSLVRGGQGGIPADESRYSYIPIATDNSRATPSTIATAKPSNLSGESFPCARLQP